MNIFHFRDELIRDYAEYIASFINVRDGRIRAYIEEKLKAGVLWPQPLIQALYRPFTKRFLYYAPMFIDRLGSFAEYFPNVSSTKENRVIVIPGEGNRKPFGCVMANLPVSFDFAFEKVQCFPLYTYADYGRERRDNIPRTTLDRFINYYDDDKITSKDIFHYVYAVLHHPEYRKRDIAAAKRFFSRATR